MVLAAARRRPEAQQSATTSPRLPPCPKGASASPLDCLRFFHWVSLDSRERPLKQHLHHLLFGQQPVDKLLPAATNNRVGSCGQAMLRRAARQEPAPAALCLPAVLIEEVVCCAPFRQDGGEAAHRAVLPECTSRRWIFRAQRRWCLSADGRKRRHSNHVARWIIRWPVIGGEAEGRGSSPRGAHQSRAGGRGSGVQSSRRSATSLRAPRAVWFVRGGGRPISKRGLHPRRVVVAPSADEASSGPREETGQAGRRQRRSHPQTHAGPSRPLWRPGGWTGDWCAAAARPCAPLEPAAEVAGS